MAVKSAFALLPDIKTCKPRLPILVDDPPSLEADPSDFPEARSNFGFVSTDFQQLIDRVVEQHIYEMSKCKGPGNGNVEIILARDTSKQSTESMHTVSDTSQRSALSGQSEDPRKSRQSGVSVSGILREKHKEMREIQASEILDAWGDSVNPAAFRETTMLSAFKSRDFSEDFNSESPKNGSQMTRLEKLQKWLESPSYEALIAFVLCINVLWMAFELQLYGTLAGVELQIYQKALVGPESLEQVESIVQAVDIAFSALFTFDVLLRVAVLGKRFWMVAMNYIDLAVSVASMIELTLSRVLTLPVPPILFRLLRMGKLARAFRMVTMTSVLGSLQLLVKCLAASSNMLFWSFCLLTFVQCVAGLIIATLCRDFFTDASYGTALQEEVFRYYGTFTRTFLTMFEVLFANWGPACRILTDNISEWFALFFLLYRCVFCFAVLNVVNAVFVQQTMKTASSDEELAFKQKEKDAQMYVRKVRKLFQTIDDSGDGAINLEEFAKLVQSPKLQFWMSQLELEYHDLLSLFEFLDNGDGEITLMEFVEGASRLRGHAKTLDLWRIETKLEVLFEEVLHCLKKDYSNDVVDASGPSQTSHMSASNVQHAFNNSQFRHIKTTKPNSPSQPSSPIVPQSPLNTSRIDHISSFISKDSAR